MIVAKTKMRKIPSGCEKCHYYQPGEIYSFFIDSGKCKILQRDTFEIVVSRQRLPECPLMEMEASGT